MKTFENLKGDKEKKQLKESLDTLGIASRSTYKTPFTYIYSLPILEPLWYNKHDQRIWRQRPQQEQ